ncbi:imidazole glycerol phosphate synthase subunit HisH [Flavobacteriaceae bacterium]|nr:imidazole glycerol phosphate synthase subunit HisH [Flavobacteriaceae bacterium]MDB4715209.1 imidazole glycerol phosphate synthase subunit HisH [Flavobacteriaceae bacterium]
MITIIDLNIGNIGSVVNMIKHVGGVCKVSSDPSEIKNASKLILPGVGSFDKAMNQLRYNKLEEVINEKATLQKTPLLGICLGMQLLTNSSEEGDEKGLGLINAETLSFKKAFDKKEINERIPHMGWNDIRVEQENDLTINLIESSRFYFVHSYFVKCLNKENRLMTSNYGFDFASAIVKNNVYGVQFHPEKSHKYGKKLISNFVKL